MDSYYGAYCLHLNRPDHMATAAGLRDKDAGRPMAVVPELL